MRNCMGFKLERINYFNEPITSVDTYYRAPGKDPCFVIERVKRRYLNEIKFLRILCYLPCSLILKKKRSARVGSLIRMLNPKLCRVFFAFI